MLCTCVYVHGRFMLGGCIQIYWTYRKTNLSGGAWRTWFPETWWMILQAWAWILSCTMLQQDHQCQKGSLRQCWHHPPRTPLSFQPWKASRNHDSFEWNQASWGGQTNALTRVVAQQQVHCTQPKAAKQFSLWSFLSLQSPPCQLQLYSRSVAFHSYSTKDWDRPIYLPIPPSIILFDLSHASMVCMACYVCHSWSHLMMLQTGFPPHPVQHTLTTTASKMVSTQVAQPAHPKYPPHSPPNI